MRYLIFLVTASTAVAQPSNLRTVFATQQQAVLAYEAPVGDDCQIEVSESITYTPLVHDVNNSLFANAHLDLSRASTRVEGPTRYIAIFKRKAETALDGKRYSRSGKNGTAYYLRLSNCGGTLTGSFTLQQSQWINPNDPLPHTGTEGFFGYASVSMTNRAEEIIDPTTGARIKRLTLPSDTRYPATYVGGIGATSVSGAGWTNPSKIIGLDSTPATINGSTNPIFIQNALINSNLNTTNGAASTSSSPAWLVMTATIYGSVGGAQGDDAMAQICRADLWIAAKPRCVSDWQDINMTSCASGCIVGDTGGTFSNYWTAGGFRPQALWYANAVQGFWIRKKTASPHTLSIDHFTWSTTAAEMPANDTSVPPYCSQAVITDNGDGKTWLLCAIYNTRGNSALAIYAVEISTGEARYLGAPYVQSGVNGSTFTAVTGKLLWSKTNGRVAYFIRSGQIWKMTISSAAGVLSTDSTTAWTRQSTNFTYAQITPTAAGYTLSDQVAAFDPRYNNYDGAGTRWPYSWNVDVMQNGKMVIFAWQGQDQGAWVIVYDPSLAAVPGIPGSNGCTGNVCEGRVIASRPFGVRAVPQNQKFCVLHSISKVEDSLNSVQLGEDWASNTANADPFAGPYRVVMSAIGGGPLGTSGTAFQLAAQTNAYVSNSYNFLDPTPSSLADASMPFEVGDEVWVSVSGSVEKMEIASYNPETQTGTLLRGNQRAAQSAWWYGTGLTPLFSTNLNIPASASVYGSCRFQPSMMWDFVRDPMGTGLVLPAVDITLSPTISDRLYSGGHNSYSGAHRIQFAIGTELGCRDFYSADNECYVVHSGPADAFNSAINKMVALKPAFAGVVPVSVTTNTHPNQLQYAYAPNDRNSRYFVDVRPVETAPGISALVAGTTNVYKVTGVTLNRKHFATHAYTPGGRVFRDISGAGSVIDDTQSYTYCVALVANECRTGSSAGDIYINNPLYDGSNCGIENGGVNPVHMQYYWEKRRGNCIYDKHPAAPGLVVGDGTSDDPAGRRMKVVSSHMARPLQQGLFQLGTTLAGGKWTIHLGEDYGMPQFYLVGTEMADDTSRNPLTFDWIGMNLAPPSGAAAFRVEFGYEENGTASQYRCTTRQEACVIDTVALSDSAPFKWASESPGWIPLSGGRAVARIPRIPGRVVFARAVWRNAGGAEIGSTSLPPM